jgi:prepilin signal peptidase PulO-like enzyme (type II secretory pathway)
MPPPLPRTSPHRSSFSDPRLAILNRTRTRTKRLIRRVPFEAGWHGCPSKNYHLHRNEFRCILIGVLMVQLSIALTVIAGAVDAGTSRIPDFLTYGGIGMALAVAALDGLPDLAYTFSSSAIAGAVFWVSRRVSGGKLGCGDIKLSAMVGALLGFELWILAVFWSLSATALYFIVVRATSGSVPLTAPFAPFLAVGVVTVHAGRYFGWG